MTGATRGETDRTRLIVASVRLPVSVHSAEHGWDVRSTAGGLATVLGSLARHAAFVWIGWPGGVVPPPARRGVEDSVLAAQPGSVPLFLDQDEIRQFYGDFSNQLLWPLFHHLPQSVEFEPRSWACYRRVNERFADAIAAQARPTDIVWVHDYHLCLVPELLRQKGLTCPIGFFLHIPFPSWDAYRTLPVREEILRGMLGADVLGFHCYGYIDEFRRACLRILDLNSEPDAVHLPSHTVHLEELPIGIDAERVGALAQSEDCQAALSGLRQRFAGCRIVLGVDRLDPAKGLPQKLLAFEQLLEERPQWRERVVLIQVAAPSRTELVDYQSLKRSVDEVVGRINGRFGTPGWTPVVYINRSSPLEQLVPLYRLADALFVASLRDGMNVVSLEYVAARRLTPGALLLSEFTGAASYLPGATLINPHDRVGMAAALARTLESPPSRRAFDEMTQFVSTNTSASWARHFVQRLVATRSSKQALHQRITRLTGVLRSADHPLLLLSYDGTLRSYVPAVFSEAEPGARLKTILRQLAEGARVYVLSGRPAEQMQAWLGELPIGLVCEHGLSIRHPGMEWLPTAEVDHAVLKAEVRPALERFCEETPGSAIEEKTGSIAWHYRGVDPAVREWRSRRVVQFLRDRLAGTGYAVISGKHVLEVRHTALSQSAAVRCILHRHSDAELVFAAGTEPADSELLEAVELLGRARAVACRVGSPRGACYVNTCEELVETLEELGQRWTCDSEIGAEDPDRALAARTQQ
jgi:trehalose 6-phosphate synthase/phosphatase